MVSVQVEVEQVHEREQVADVQRAGGRIDAGVNDNLARVHQRAELSFGAAIGVNACSRHILRESRTP